MLRVASLEDFLVRNGHSAWNRLTVTFTLSRGSHSCSNIPTNSGIIWANTACAHYDQMLPARSRRDVRNSRPTWSYLACVCVDPKLSNLQRRFGGGCSRGPFSLPILHSWTTRFCLPPLSLSFFLSPLQAFAYLVRTRLFKEFGVILWLTQIRSTLFLIGQGGL